MIPAAVTLAIAFFSATWYLAQQLATLNATMREIRDDVREAKETVEHVAKQGHDHESRILALEIKFTQ